MKYLNQVLYARPFLPEILYYDSTEVLVMRKYNPLRGHEDEIAEQVRAGLVAVAPDWNFNDARVGNICLDSAGQPKLVDLGTVQKKRPEAPPWAVVTEVPPWAVRKMK